MATHSWHQAAALPVQSVAERRAAQAQAVVDHLGLNHSTTGRTDSRLEAFVRDQIIVNVLAHDHLKHLGNPSFETRETVDALRAAWSKRLYDRIEQEIKTQVHAFVVEELQKHESLPPIRSITGFFP